MVSLCYNIPTKPRTKESNPLMNLGTLDMFAKPIVVLVIVKGSLAYTFR